LAGPFAGGTLAEALATNSNLTDAIRPEGLVDYLRGIVERLRATPRDRLCSRSFQIAGQSILARFSNEDRAALYAARLPNSDSSTDRGEPDFHIDVIETTRLGWPAPPLLKVPNGDRKSLDRALEESGFRAVPPFRPRLWEFMDKSENRAVQLSRTYSDLPEWDAGAPLRIQLHWASLDRGRRIIHGATVGNGRIAMLIVGPGGAGKSGTTLAGIAHGLRTVGDDYVVIEPGTPPRAWQIYRLLKQDEVGLARFPELACRISNRRANWQGKLELDPESLFPGCFEQSQRIGAILVPRIERVSKSAIEAVDREQAFDALVRSTLQQFPNERGSGFLFCRKLTRSLPCFAMSLSQDPSDIAASLTTFLEGLDS